MWKTSVMFERDVVRSFMHEIWPYNRSKPAHYLPYIQSVYAQFII